MSQGQTGGPDRLRLAVISSPRTGNTWMRTLLSATYGLEQFAVHAPWALDWEGLPERAVVQIHWLPEPDFLDRLARAGFRVVTLARHPLDLLLSSLNYTTYVHLSGRCPGGGACGECGVAGRTPRSPEHMAYATSKVGSAANLFTFSLRWWPRPEVIRVRYRDLVGEPIKELARIAGKIGAEPRVPAPRVLELTAIGRLKKIQDSWHCHYWQGRPDLWKSMFPEAEARAIEAAHPEAFRAFGFDCDPDPDLEPSRADLNWLQLQLDSTRENLDLEQSKRKQVDNQLAGTRARLARFDRKAAPTIKRLRSPGTLPSGSIVDSPEAAT